MLRLVLNSAGIFITSILNSLSRRLPWVLYFLQGFSIFQLRVVPLSSLYLHFCIYGFRWKLPLVTLKAYPYMGASLYRLYPGYVGHHHRGAGGAEPLQGVARLLCSEAPTPSGPGECLLPGQSGRPEGSPELAVPSGRVSCFLLWGRCRSTWGPGVYWHLCPCSHAAASRLSHGGCPGSSARRGCGMGGGGSAQLGVGGCGFTGLPCCQRVGCLCSAECQQRPPPICPHARPLDHLCPQIEPFPGTWLPSCGVECGAGVLLSSGWGAWQGGHRVSCLSTLSSGASTCVLLVEAARRLQPSSR